MIKRLLQFVFLVALTIGPLSARAQIAFVMHIPNVNGTSTVTNHINDIDITTFSWGVAVPYSVNGQAGQTSFSDITVTKPLDVTSPTLASKCANGVNLGTVTLYAVRLGGTRPGDFYKVSLSNCSISSVSVSAGGTTPSESITLHFPTPIQWTYVPLTGANVVTQYP